MILLGATSAMLIWNEKLN